MPTFSIPSEAEWQVLAAWLLPRLQPGDLVLLHGAMGAGKTSLARSILAELGYLGPVRSPTYPIYIPYDTVPAVVHADLYRVEGLDGLDLAEVISGCIALVEWAERAPELERLGSCWHVTIVEEGTGRQADVTPPPGRT